MGIEAQNKRQNGLRILFSLIALAVVLARMTSPELFERIDGVSVTILAIGIIPWIAPFISKISIPGFFEAELREIKHDVQQAKQYAESAADIAFRSQDAAILPVTGSFSNIETDAAAATRLTELARRYVSMRSEMQPGDRRTAQMDKLFSEMLIAASKLGANWSGSEIALGNSDPGMQLAGIAHAFSFPSTANITGVIQAIENAKQPFIQYWGLRTIQRAMQNGAAYSLRDLERIRLIASSLLPGTDRYLVAKSLIKNLPN